MDSLQQLLKNSGEDTNRVNILWQLSELCEEKDILKYAEPAYALSCQLNFDHGIALSAYNIGFSYEHTGRLREALHYFTISRDYFIRANDQENLSYALNNIGRLQLNTGKLMEGLENFHSALVLQEKQGNKEGMAETHSNIGFAYRKLDNYKMAEVHFFSALNLSKEANDQFRLGQAYGNLGANYRNFRMFDSALYYMKKSLDLCLKTDNIPGAQACYHNIGSVYNDIGTIDSAIIYLRKGIYYGQLHNDIKGVAQSMNFLGSIYISSRQYKEAFAITDTALTYAKRLGLPAIFCNSYRNLSDLHARTGNFQKAYESHKLYKLYYDSLSNMELLKEAEKKQIEYEYEEKAIRVQAIQEKKDAIAKQEKREQRIILVSTIIGFACVIIFSLILLNKFRVIRKQKNIIEDQKKLVEKQKDFVEEKQKAILDSIEYARRIQHALITSQKYIERNLRRLNP